MLNVEIVVQAEASIHDEINNMMIHIADSNTNFS